MTNSWSMLYDEILKMDDHINFNKQQSPIDFIPTLILISNKVLLILFQLQQLRSNIMKRRL
jgi:hypothetical protein